MTWQAISTRPYLSGARRPRAAAAPRAIRAAGPGARPRCRRWVRSAAAPAPRPLRPRAWPAPAPDRPRRRQRGAAARAPGDVQRHRAWGQQSSRGELPGRALQVEPMKPQLKAPGTKRLKLNMMYSFQTMLLNSTCAATTRSMDRERRRARAPRAWHAVAAAWRNPCWTATMTAAGRMTAVSAFSLSRGNTAYNVQPTFNA